MDAMLLIKVTIVLSLALIVAHLVRRAAAVTRHRLWTAAFASVLALPLLAFGLPVLHVPVPQAWKTIATRDVVAARHSDNRARIGTPAPIDPPLAAPARTGRESVAIQSADAQSGIDVPAESILLLVWLTGTAVALAGLLVSLFRARRLAASAEAIDDPAWRTAAAKIGARLGTPQAPRLLVTRKAGSPMAGGIWRPVIFLPVSSAAWTAERREVVLAHEIAHLAGRDPLRHVIARVAVALYWFHPFVWLAAWHASVAREQACDEAVLALGTRPSAYARILLDLAESVNPPVAGVAALSMVESSLLEVRLMTILKNDSHAEKKHIIIPAAVVALLTLPLAAAQPVRSPQASSVAPAVPARAAQTTSLRDVACVWDGSDSSSTRISGTERLVQQSFGDLKLCMVAIDAGDRVAGERPSQWVGRARRVIIETRQPGAVQRIEIVRTAGGGEQVSWQVGSAARPFDSAAGRWRDRVVALLDTTWELAALRGEVSSLRGEISSVRGQESALRGEISSLRGEVSALRGRASSVRGEESALRGQISAIEGHLSALGGAISAERGAISAVNASRYGATAAERAQIDARIRRHEAEIEGVEREIRDYNAQAKIAEAQKEIVALHASARTAAIDSEIGAFDLAGKIAAVEQRIAALGVSGKIAAIERQIAALDADRRSRQLQERRQLELKQLEEAIAAIR